MSSTSTQTLVLSESSQNSTDTLQIQKISKRLSKQLLTHQKQGEIPYITEYLVANINNEVTEIFETWSGSEYDRKEYQAQGFPTMPTSFFGAKEAWFRIKSKYNDYKETQETKKIEKKNKKRMSMEIKQKNQQDGLKRSLTV
ncbi:hypothetical protein HK099_002612 [Clydaea vesicula]|uniref:Uncharacterized protein n=1 Tax=Clydaea vesicula TaxID=447962 RepID=A0AAD5TT57_9FUNG|nr:hypothetical protein HK099_002612 [Clydaea vesicula]